MGATKVLKKPNNKFFRPIQGWRGTSLPPGLAEFFQAKPLKYAKYGIRELRPAIRGWEDPPREPSTSAVSTGIEGAMGAALPSETVEIAEAAAAPKEFASEKSRIQQQGCCAMVRGFGDINER